MTEETTLGTDTWYVDVAYKDAEHLIAAGVLETDAGLVLIDPGPTASLDGLQRGLEDQGAAIGDIAAILLTHIHLDHAGATGTIARDHPEIDVYVHRVGASHVADPSRLLKSARRLYGDQMDALWGAVVPVPSDNVHVVTEGDTLEIGGRTLAVAYTPGHAKHHVSYLDHRSGTAFIGDTGGQRTTGVDYVVPVTPPPGIDLEAWEESFQKLRAWDAERLFLTHFGPSGDPETHLDRMQERLRRWGDEVRRSLSDESRLSDESSNGDAERAAAFAKDKLEEMRRVVPQGEQLPYERFGRPDESWHGLARYWRTVG